MQPLKWILNEDGTVINETRSFQIKQHESGNTLVTLSVPTDILVGTIFDQDGEIPASSKVKTVSVVSMGASMRSESGKLVAVGSPLFNEDGTPMIDVNPQSPTFEKQYIMSTFRLRKIKNYTDPQGKQMTLFQRALPNAFVLYSGKTTITLNIVNISFENDSERELSAIRGQIEIDVEPTNNIGDITREPSELDWLQGQIDEHEERIDTFENWKNGTVNPNLANYKNRITSLERWGHGDPLSMPDTYPNSVDGRLEDCEDRIETVEGWHDDFEQRVTSNEQRLGDQEQTLADIRSELNTGFSFLGTVFSNELDSSTTTEDGFPTDSYLNARVSELENRNPQSGDKFYFQKNIENELDTLWSVSFSVVRGWQFVEIPALEAASNKHLGSIRGTYYVGANADLVVDIVDGVILDIYIRNRADEEYSTIRNNIITLENLANQNSEKISKIILGIQTVGLALNSNKLNNKYENELQVLGSTKADTLKSSTSSTKYKAENELDVNSAVRDGDQQNIVATYRRIDDSYSKIESDLRFSRKTFNQNFYITSGGMSVPLPISQGVQFTAVVDNTGESQIMRMATVTETDIILTSQQTLTVRPYLELTSLIGEIGVVTASARVVIAYRKIGELSETVIADTSDAGYVLTYGTTERLDDIETPFTSIGFGDEVELNSGDEFIVYLYMSFYDANPKQVDVITSGVYPSSVLFVSDTLNISIINDRARLYQIPATAWNLNEVTGLYEHTVLMSNGQPQIVFDTEYVDLTGRRADGSKIMIDVRRNVDGTISAIAEQAEDLTCWVVGGIIQVESSLPMPPDNVNTYTLKTVAGVLQWVTE